jgi:hypothetical protein
MIRLIVGNFGSILSMKPDSNSAVGAAVQEIRLRLPLGVDYFRLSHPHPCEFALDVTAVTAGAGILGNSSQVAMNGDRQMRGIQHMKTQSVTLDQLIEALDDVIAKITSAGFGETVALLNIARLDLVLRANGFSEDDLEAFLSALEENQRLADHATPSDQKMRRRKQTIAAGNC